MPVDAVGDDAEAVVRGQGRASRQAAPCDQPDVSADLETTRKTVGGNAVKTFAIRLFFFLALRHSGADVASGAGRRIIGVRAMSSVLDDRDCDRQKAALAPERIRTRLGATA